jgi:ABC-type iron transport system FetAB ATPase subunit
MLRIAELRSPLAGPFDLEVAAGACVAITGPSGSGKSLFLRMIADLDPNQGEVALDGRDRRSFPAPEWRRRVVYNAAETGWWDDQVAPHFPLLPRAREMAPALGLDTELLDGPVLRLSTGERQRLALIRTLLLEPPVLLLDEPTGALDAASTELVEAILRRRLAAGTAIVMVTHSPEQAGRLGHQHFRMADRRMVAA